MITNFQIETLRRMLHQHTDMAIDTILSNPDTFLDELREPVETPYEMAAEQATEPELPNMDDIEPLTAELKERLDLVPEFQQDEKWELLNVGEERHTKILEWIILKKATLEHLQNFMAEKKVRFTEKEFEHLKNILWYRHDDVFDLKSIFSQKDTTEAEMVLWQKSDKK